MASNELRNGLQPENIKPLLLAAIKWLKIILAVLMFVLGLINEGIQMDPTSSPQELEETTDSLFLSLVGLAITCACTCPLMLCIGQCIGAMIS